MNWFNWKLSWKWNNCICQKQIRVYNEHLKVKTRVADPDPVGSGFKISLDPVQDPVSVQILENCKKVSKSELSEENLKFMTKDRQKMKKATISY